jgi:hypothetical protein
MSDSPLSLFFSYALQDEVLRDELAKHLSSLERNGSISSWHDRRILPGEEREHQIDQNLNTADIILLLVSPDFMASNYCWNVEVAAAMNRHERGEVFVIPIILRSVDWTGAPFSKLQFLPKNASPITLWPDRDAAFKDVVQGIRETIENLVECRNTKQGIKNKSKKNSFDILLELALTRDEMVGGIEKTIFLRNDEVISINIPSGTNPGDCIFEPEKGGLPEGDGHRGDLYLKIVEIQEFKTDINSKSHKETFSESDVKYNFLNEYLASGRWMEADYETLDLLLEIAGGEDLLSDESVNTFPCEALCTIDKLWKNYSNGRFGFSVQRRIWLECGGSIDFESEQLLGVRVGWLKKEIRPTPFGTLSEQRLIKSSEVSFSKDALVGHLPAVWYIKHFSLIDIKNFFSQLKNCGL